MKKLSLVNRLMKTDSSKILHTSAHARAQMDGSGVGPQSFSERQAIAGQRQYVQSYHKSRLGASPYNRRIVQDINQQNVSSKVYDTPIGIVSDKSVMDTNTGNNARPMTPKPVAPPRPINSIVRPNIRPKF